MKSPGLFALSIALAFATAGNLAAQDDHTHGDPYVPVGSLSVNPKYVPVGTKPNMNWSITYPEIVGDIIEPTPTGRIVTKRAVRMRVRVVGVAFQSGNLHLPVALWARVGSGSSWELLFNGKFNQVKPDRYVYDALIPAGTTIDFSGRGGSRSGAWGDARTTEVDDVGVVGLSNGEIPPNYVPAYNQDTIESYLSGFLGKNNNGHGNNLDGVDSSNPGGGDWVDPSGTFDDEAKRVSLGPKEMIYLFELGTRDTSKSYFDMQDLVMVLTFAEETTQTGN